MSLAAVVHQRGGRYLMKPVDGFWEFPMFPELPAGEFEMAGRCRHTITHHRLDVIVYRGGLKRTPGYEWKEIATVPISSLTRKIAALALQP